MREVRTSELTEDMLGIIEYHLPGRSKDTIAWYENFTHDTVLFYDDEDRLDSMLSYFSLDFRFDTMIAMQREDKFSKRMWKILRDTLVSRVKPIRIMSDPKKKALHKAAARYGGKFYEDEVFFD